MRRWLWLPALAVPLALYWWSAQPKAFKAPPAVPSDAQAWVMTAPLTDNIAAVKRLSGQLRGAAALTDALGAVVGLRSLSDEQLAAVGVRPRSPVAVFAWRGSLWLWVASDDARRDEAWAQWAARQGLSLQRGQTQWLMSAAEGGAIVAVVHMLHGQALIQAPLPERFAKAIGQSPENSWAAADVERSAAAALQAWKAAEKLPWDERSAAVAHLEVPPGGLLQKRARGVLGPAGLLFGGVVDTIRSSEFRLNLSAEALELSAKFHTLTGGNQAFYDYYVKPFKQGHALQLGDVLPDEVALWGLAHINPDLLKWIPSVLLRRALPKGALGALHSDLAAIDPREDLLQQWNGRVALGLLGVSPTAPLPTSPRAVRRLWSEFGAFVAVGLKDAKAPTAVLESVREQTKAGSGQPSEIALGPWRGVSLGGEKVSISLLARDSNLLMIFGRGELERFRRVQRGKFPSWSGAARHPLERSIGEDTEGWLKIAASMGRIARAARRRGVPDTIVSMVRSVAAVAGRVQVDADGFEFALELRPREARP